jgi:hypothetical protein
MNKETMIRDMLRSELSTRQRKDLEEHKLQAMHQPREVPKEIRDQLQVTLLYLF